jgi:hypothetical protein
LISRGNNTPTGNTSDGAFTGTLAAAYRSPYAISQTTAGGEVVAVDSSGSGPVTITSPSR